MLLFLYSKEQPSILRNHPEDKNIRISLRERHQLQTHTDNTVGSIINALMI